ncbi:tyrosine-type recombinase/integrase [Enterococcus dispar]|uniref:tyrosine-type recombinase/integrase n=1 Tax=Enterococcus dispar TaxID=44009 RepID=UPI00189D679A|nr:site-specific integrase [Enterococcus dispar]
MWMETLPDGRFKYIERYKDPYTEKYKRKSIILTSDSKQAQKKAQKLLDEKIGKAEETATLSDINLHNLVEEWFSHHQKVHRIRPSTIRAYKAQQKVIFDKIDKNTLAKNADTKLFQTFFDGLDYSNDYVSSIKSQLNNVFKYAYRMGYIKENPLDKVQISYSKKDDVAREKIENKYLEKDEAEKLIKELYRRPSTYRAARLAEFMYLTGCRIGEAVILTPEDFSEDFSSASITGTIDYGNGFRAARKGPPKTLMSNRTINLTPRCIKLVERSIDENKLDSLTRNGYLPGEYVFVTKNGTPMIYSSFNRALVRAGERVGLAHKTLTSHIFRHTHVSLLAENGIQLTAIMERVGHEDSDITTKIYTHVTKKMKADITSKLTEIGL